MLSVLFQISELILILEMVACDGSCASLRPSVVALVLLCTYLDTAVNRLNANANGNASVLTNGPSTRDTATVPLHQVLRDKFALFTKWLQNECNVKARNSFLLYKLYLFFIFIYTVMIFLCFRYQNKVFTLRVEQWTSFWASITLRNKRRINRT